MKKEISTVVLALVIAVPLSIYASEQAKLNAEAHKNDFRPVAEVRVVELVEITQEAVPEELEAKEPEYISLGEFKLTAYCS